MLKYLCFCSVLFLNLHIKGQRPDATTALNLTTTLSSEAYKARLPVYTMAGANNLHRNSGATYKFGEGVAANTYAQYNQPPALEYFRHSYGH